MKKIIRLNMSGPQARLTVPKVIVERLKWKDGQYLSVEETKDGVTIKTLFI